MVEFRPSKPAVRVRSPSPAPFNYPGTIAQLGEHLPYKQGVTGSSPVGPTIKICGNSSAVERNLAKVEVASSNLVSRSILWVHSSAG